MTPANKQSDSLRNLAFDDLPGAVNEAKLLLASGYVQHGNWSLGQVCRHLRLVQDPSIDGYPWWMSIFAPLRPVMRTVLMRRVLRGDSPRGIPTASIFKPPQDLDDAAEVQAFAESVERFLSHQGKWYPHPGFGRLDRDQLEQVHTAHAAHHLRFLGPRTSNAIHGCSAS